MANKTSYKFQIQILRLFQDYHIADYLDTPVVSMLNEAFDLNALKFILGHIKKDSVFGPAFDLKGKDAKIAVRRIILKTIFSKIFNEATELEFTGEQIATLNETLLDWAVGNQNKITFNDILNGTEEEDVAVIIQNKINKLKEMLKNGEGNKKSIQSMISKYKAKLKAMGITPEGDEEEGKPETSDVAKILIAKIAKLKEMLANGEGNKKSVQSMISKYKAKLKELGIAPESSEEVSKQEKIATIKAKIEQYELDLSLAPDNKVKSIKSMISKLRAKLRELAPEELEDNKEPEITFEDVKEYFEDFEFNQEKPYHKEIMRFLKECSKEYVVKAKIVLELIENEKNIFTNHIFGTFDDNSKDGTALTWLTAAIIEDTVLSDLASLGKSSMTKSLSIEDLFALTTDENNIIYPDIDSQSVPLKKLKAFAKVYSSDPDKARKASKKRAELNAINDIDDELDTDMNGAEPIQNLI